MASPVQFRVNTREFDAAIKQYVKYSRRAIPTIVNTKAFYIARRAVVMTPKTAKSKIPKIRGKTGAILGRIINMRRGKRGEKGLYGEKMAEAVAMVRAARLRSVAFLKSGWLPAIKALAPLAERPGRGTVAASVQQIGRPKGSAKPATEGFRSRAIIENLASARHDTKEALIKYGAPALEKAFAFETASMLEYIERKMKQAAQQSGIRTS